MYPNSKVFPGSECQPYYGAQAGDFTTSHLSIRNDATTTRWVTCPLITDNGNVAKTVSVDNYSPSGTTTSCMIFNMNGFGVQNWNLMSVAGYGYKAGMTFNTYARTDADLQTLLCALPAKGELYKYRANW
jgi:hypothetical protein